MKTAVIALMMLVAGTVGNARGATYDPPLLNPSALGPFTLYFIEVPACACGELAGLYQGAMGSGLQRIEGELADGGVRYDLDQIDPNLNLTFGDLVLNDPGIPARRSDILRFALLPNENRIHTVLFLSDQDELGEPAFSQDTSLGDITLQRNNVATDELATLGRNLEEADGVLYKPERGCCDPGFDPSGVIKKYNVISDVPEPGTAVLIGIGLSGLLGCKRRRTRQSAERSCSQRSKARNTVPIMKNGMITVLTVLLLASLTTDALGATFVAPILDPNPPNLPPFTLYLQEGRPGATPDAFYQGRTGTRLIPIGGFQRPESAGGGVLYDLNAIIGNLNLVAGDLVLVDPGNPAVRSDILRFATLPDETRIHTVLLLSDPEEAGETADSIKIRADTNLSAVVLQTNNLVTDELAIAGSKLEAVDGILYKPEICCDPGFDPNGVVQNFNLISDGPLQAIPEPASLLLFAPGLVTLATMLRRNGARVVVKLVSIAGS